MPDKSSLKHQLQTILLKHHGRMHAITGQELAQMLGERDDRQIRLSIRQLITDGWPIASSNESPAGYFMVATWEEARRYADSIKGRLIEDAIRRRDFNRAAAFYLKPAEQGKLV